jgi:hypothetical protein
MPVNCMKSRIAFSYARQVLRLVILANHSTSGGTPRRLLGQRAAGRLGLRDSKQRPVTDIN